MNLDQAIDKALQRLEHGGLNEANLRAKVINPILAELGYGEDDYDLEESGPGGKPDYTILPQDKKHRFFLEAKAPHLELEDKHAEQVTGYAFQNASRWAVLTNGWNWRLYDTKEEGFAKDRLDADVSLKDRKRVVCFLTAIGKPSVLAGKLEGYAVAERARRRREEETMSKQERLRTALDSQLQDPSSPLIGVIRDFLATQSGFDAITTQEIAVYFGQRKGDNGKDLRKLFWEEFIKVTAERGLTLFFNAKIDPRGHDVNLDLEERWFKERDCWLFYKLERTCFLAGLWIEKAKREGNPRVFQFLLERRQAIEGALEFQLEWYKYNRKKDPNEPTAIVLKSKIDMKRFAERSNWAELREDLVRAMTGIHKVFGEHLRELPQS